MRTSAAVIAALSACAVVVACSPSGPPAVALPPSGGIASAGPTADASAHAPATMADLSGPDDVRPTDHTVPAPPGDFSPIAFPADVHVEPPADGWWNQKDACPAGKKVVSEPLKMHNHPWTAHHCDGGKGGPSTTIRDDADEREEGWWDADGKPHGAIRWLTVGYDDTRIYVHGQEEGRWTSRSRDGRQDSFSNYRGGHCHGEQRRDLGERASGGWCVNGESEGTWFVWNKSWKPGQTDPDVVRARLRYKASALHGAQRWWTKEGVVLARGAFIDGEGTWSLVAPGGKTRAETRCKGRELVEATAWWVLESGETVTLRVCGRGAPAGCVAQGPIDPQETFALGADRWICDDPTVPPLGLL